MKFNSLITGHMLGVLSAVVNKKAVYILPEKLDWNKLYYLASSHKVANTVNYRILGANIKIPKDVQANFTWSFQQAVYLNQNQNQVLDKLLPALSQAGVEVMVMRDFVLKSFYPHKDMRIAEHLEFLVEAQKDRQIYDILSSMGYERENFSGARATVYRKERVGEIRFYHNLDCSSRKMQKYLSSLWKRTYQPRKESTVREMSWEDFYLYMICDMANAFSLKKLDIRDIMDLWMFMKKFPDGLNWVYINMELKNMELSVFERYLHRLSMLWFGESRKFDPDPDILDSLCLDLEQMIVTKGEEGFASCKEILPLVDEIERWHEQEKRKEERRRLRRWLFPNRHYMQAQYTVLKKLPGCVIPIFWIIRLAGISLGHLTLPLRKRVIKAIDPIISKIHSKFPKKVIKGKEESPADLNTQNQQEGGEFMDLDNQLLQEASENLEPNDSTKDEASGT